MKRIQLINDLRQRKLASLLFASKLQSNTKTNRNHLLSFKLFGIVTLAILAATSLLYLNNTSSKTTPTHLSDLQSLPASTASDSNNITGTSVDSTLPNHTASQGNPSNNQQSTSNNISTSVSVSANNSSNPETTQVSVNGQPVAQPTNGTTEHSSVISSPNQTTSFSVSSDSSNNGTTKGFNSSDEHLSVNSTSVSRNQEGD